jgi:hypothetical protein
MGSSLLESDFLGRGNAATLCSRGSISLRPGSLGIGITDAAGRGLGKGSRRLGEEANAPARGAAGARTPGEGQERVAAGERNTRSCFSQLSGALWGFVTGVGKKRGDEAGEPD